jgi:hypothetical protein
MSDYRQALEAAGANVLVFDSFGDWQGSWIALVVYEGALGWVQGSFGSCDHCDAFQSEFGWDSDFVCEDVQDRLAQFGRTYLDDLMTTEEILGHYDPHADWDDDSASAAAWVRHTAEKYKVAS